MMLRFVRVASLVAMLAAAVGLTGCKPGSVQPLRIVVMDPLAAPLACECVDGFAQRDYGRLGVFLSKQLGRPVEVAFSESLGEALRLNGRDVDLIIGKQSIVLADAAAAKLPVRPIARLTGLDGRTDLTGLVVVRTDDPARDLTGLKGRRVLLGPPDSDEKHAAAKALFAARGVPLGSDPDTRASCNAAAVDVADDKADAAVISSYALALLVGCDAIDKGVLRVLDRTEPVPFVTVFATPSISPADAPSVLTALQAVRSDRGVLKAIESANGFVPVGPGG